MDKKKKILFLVNPISGKGKNQRVVKYIEQYLDKTVFDSDIRFTESAGHATLMSREAAEKGIDVVVAVGGDGTVNEVATGLTGYPTALGIIPAGSGNGLSRHLKIPANVIRAIRVINRCRIAPIDTATIDGSLFVNVAGLGFDAAVAKAFSEAATRGFSTYFRITAQSYRNYRPRKYILVIDGKKIKRRALMVSFANSSQFGNNATIDSRASVTDGFIDVCIIGKMPYWKVPFLAPLLFLRRFDQTRYVEIIRAKEVIVKQKKKRVIHVDGDPRDAPKEIVMKINPLSLNVILPQEATAH